MLKKKDTYVVAIAGATGAVGREMVEILEERNFPVSELRLLASERSEGERITYRDKGTTVHRLTGDAFSGVDIALFSAGAQRSLDYAPRAVRAGAVVIDNSSAFRMEPAVPLVVPEVNAQALTAHAGIVANPNCSAIGLVVAIRPLHDAARIRRIVITTLQSVSGSGRKAMDELAQQTIALMNFKEIEKKAFPHQIAFNCIPQVDRFLDGGETAEEEKLASETRKILGDDSLRITATAVRVPVFRGHSAAVSIETERMLEPNEARALLSEAPGIVLYDDPARNLYPLPIDASGKDDVFVGRIRKDESVPNGLNLWFVSDNLRKGSALNAVQIAELLIR